MSYDIPSVSELEAVQLLNKHYAEVVTSKKDGIASGSDITQTTNPITGVTRRTLYKILDDAQAEHDAQIAAHESEHDAQIAAHESEHDNQMQSFEDDFDNRLAGMAFTRVGTFTSGATLTDMRQVLIWEVSQGGDGHEYGWAGTFPKVVPAGATPATSGGIGAGAWVDRTDVALRPSVIEALRRSYVEAGYNLVAGSFEVGGTLVNSNDVLLHEASGKAFSGPAGVVPAGANPASGGFVDKSGGLLRHELATSDGAAKVGNANGGSVQDFIDAQYTTVAELATGKFQVGQYVRLTDRAMGLFLLQVGGVPNGRAILDAGNGNTAVYTQTTVLYVKHLLNQGEADSSEAANAACTLAPVSGGIVSFEGVGETNINTQVLVKKHTFIDLANATVSSTLDDVIFYFNKNGLNSGLPSYHGGDGGLNYWCDNRTGISNGRLYGKVTAPFLTNQYLAASDRIIGFTMHNVSCSYTNALQLNGESWLADIQSVKGYNIVGKFFKHQLDPWGTWEETPGVPIGIGNGPNNANYINCWVENRVGSGTTAVGWDIQSGSATIVGGYVEALDIYFKGSAIKASNVKLGSRHYAATIFKIDRAGSYVAVDNCSLAIANTSEVNIFDALVPTTIVHTGGVINISFSGNNCSYLKSIAEVSLTCGSGLQINKTATNVDFWDFLNLEYDGVTTFGALNNSDISGLTIKSSTGKWVNFLKQGATGLISNSNISGNTFNRCDNFNKIESSVLNSNKFTGGNVTNFIRLQLTDSVANDNNFTDVSVMATLDALTKAHGNKGWVGTQRSGTLTANGDGVNRIFRVSHGLPTGAVILKFDFIPLYFSSSSLTPYYIQEGSGYIDVIFNTAPPVGTGNVNFKWYVES